MTEIVLNQISKTYPGEVPALEDFSLRVHAGEFIAVVGPSGAGKTTLLRVIAGLEAPTSGTIRLNGRTVNADPPHARNVAMVFQRHSLYPHLTVRGNLEFALRIRRPGGSSPNAVARRIWETVRPSSSDWKRLADERVREAADVLELGSLLDRRPAQLSGGEQQRVALGKALVRRPEIYLLDEPLSQLDSRLRAEMRQYLHLLHRRVPATMVYVTHDQSEAMILGQRIAVLRQGCLQQVDSPQDLYSRPRNRFVAGFVGSPPTNFVDGRLVDATEFLAAGSWRLALAAWQASALQNRFAKEVTLGIRPEHVRLADGGGSDCSPEMEVAMVESLGSDSAVTFRRDSLELVAKMPGRPPVRVGEKRKLKLQMEQALWFDPTTGLALEVHGPAG
jgi:multiple sugar transport system ATP-binding protein